MDKYRVTQNKVTKRFRIEELDNTDVYRPMPLEKKHVFFADAVNRVAALKDKEAEETAEWVPVRTQKEIFPKSRFDNSLPHWRTDD